MDALRIPMKTQEGLSDSPLDQDNLSPPGVKQRFTAQTPIQRPLSIILLCIGMLLFSVFHLVRLGVSVTHWQFINQLPLILPPFYLTFSGAFWGITGLMITTGLWLGQAQTPTITRGYVLLYSLSYWMERVFLSTNPVTTTNAPFALAINGLLVAWCWNTLGHPRTQIFFGELHD